MNFEVVDDIYDKEMSAIASFLQKDELRYACVRMDYLIIQLSLVLSFVNSQFRISKSRSRSSSEDKTR